MKRWIKLIAGDGGAEIAEAALVLPIAFMILLGIYWFGRAFNIVGTINHAAREGARVAVANSCATCVPPNGPPLLTTIAGNVDSALKAANMNPGSVIPTNLTYTACPPAAGNAACTTTSNIQVCQNVQLQSSIPAASGNPACGITVDFQYPWEMALPFTSVNGQLMKLSAHVQMRVEQ
jgi:hypothetical protein